MSLALLTAMVVSGPATAHGPGTGPGSTYAELEQEKAVRHIWKAYFPDLQTARRAAISLHAQLLETHYEQGYLVLQLEPHEMERLRPFGFRFEPAVEFMAERDRRLTMEQIRQLSQVPGGPQPASIPGFACYETVEETFAAGDALIALKPGLGGWVDIGNSWLKTQGNGGYDMRVLKLTNSAIAGDKPKLFVQAAIHAREYTTAPLVLAFARWLVEGHGSVADATWILDHHEVHLLLHANPDGRKRAETGLSWRKNVNNNYCANTNSRGIDLNRNFSFAWNSTNGEGSSGNACDLTFRGPSPGSEPEVQAIQAYVRSLWPDRRGPGRDDAAPADTSGIHMDIHSYSQLVLWPWGDTDTPAPNGPALQTLGRRIAWFNNYTPTQSIGLYPTDGTSDNVSYGELGVAAFTIELGTSFFQSCTAYNNTVKPANLPALIYAAKVVRTPYITAGGPEVTALSLSNGAEGPGVTAGTPVTISASATDARFNQSNGTEPVQALAGAEYTIDTPPWDPDARPRLVSATDGSFNSPTETLTAGIKTSGLAPGRHIVYVRARDAGGTWGPVSAAFLNVNAAPPNPVAEAEPNDAFGTPQVIAAVPAEISGSAGAPGDADHYRVRIAAGRTLTATLTPGPTLDVNLAVLNTQGVVLSSSNRGPGQADVVKHVNSSAFDITVILRVHHVAGPTGTAGAYMLKLAL
ncbi:MAG: M14 family metallopeptidase [Aquabacterium sp.]